MKLIAKGILVVAVLLAGTAAKAQQTYNEMEQLTVNEQVTTVITATEPIRFVDISTDKIAGDQPINNTIRLKPKEAGHEDGEVLAIVTGHRHHRDGTLPDAIRLALYDKDAGGGDGQGGAAYGNDRLPQSGGVAFHGGYVPICPAGVAITRPLPQREPQTAPHDHTAEQHLRRGRLLLH